MPIAFVRCNKIGNDNASRIPDEVSSQYLRAMEMHARGEGTMAEKRRREASLSEIPCVIQGSLR